ncbi:MAG: hypothetical protein ACRES1_09300 [Steroidobacteraceae bacterium]
MELLGGQRLDPQIIEQSVLLEPAPDRRQIGRRKLPFDFSRFGAAITGGAHRSARARAGAGR